MKNLKHRLGLRANENNLNCMIVARKISSICFITVNNCKFEKLGAFRHSGFNVNNSEDTYTSTMKSTKGCY